MIQMLMEVHEPQSMKRKQHKLYQQGSRMQPNNLASKSIKKR